MSRGRLVELLFIALASFLILLGGLLLLTGADALGHTPSLVIGVGVGVGLCCLRELLAR